MTKRDDRRYARLEKQLVEKKRERDRIQQKIAEDEKELAALQKSRETTTLLQIAGALFTAQNEQLYRLSKYEIAAILKTNGYGAFVRALQDAINAVAADLDRPATQANRTPKRRAKHTGDSHE